MDKQRTKLDQCPSATDQTIVPFCGLPFKKFRANKSVTNHLLKSTKQSTNLTFVLFAILLALNKKTALIENNRGAFAFAQEKNADSLRDLVQLNEKGTHTRTRGVPNCLTICYIVCTFFFLFVYCRRVFSFFCRLLIIFKTNKKKKTTII